MKGILFILFISICLCILSSDEFKNNQGPPEEFNEHILPKPEGKKLYFI
jgi:hypothetical protein